MKNIDLPESCATPVSGKSIQWDYSALAEHYERRAPYAPAAIDTLLAAIALPDRAAALDIGAGTGRFGAMLARAGLHVTAIEPNASMRSIGEAINADLRMVWREATGEATGAAALSVDLLGYGSSFNVLDPAAALREAARVLRPRGWIACLWNHRDLDDPLQREIETAIRRVLPDYMYGTRREDPAALIDVSAQFGPVRKIEQAFVHATAATDFIAGFRAHATLQRQAGARMPAVLDAIAACVSGVDRVRVPFFTRLWFAQRRRA